jgi:hypothetical protein
MAYTIKQIIQVCIQVGKKLDAFNGNCGAFAIALSKYLPGAEFALAEDATRERQYGHVAIRYKRVYLDGSGRISARELKVYGWDENDPKSEPRIVYIPAIDDCYYEVLHGTDRNTEVEEFDREFKIAFDKVSA